MGSKLAVVTNKHQNMEIENPRALDSSRSLIKEIFIIVCREAILLYQLAAQ